MTIPYKEVTKVAIAGAIGALLFFVYSQATGSISTLPLHWFWTVLASVVLGAGAALFGVYLLARTDTSQVMHCLVFAMACGFCWAPIMNATNDLITRSMQQKLKDNARISIEKNEKQVSAVHDASADSIPAATVALSATTIDLIEAVSKVEDRTIKAEARESTEKALNALKEVFPQSPKEGSMAFSRIARAAVHGNDRQLAYSAATDFSGVTTELSDPSFVPVFHGDMGAIAVSARMANDVQLDFDTLLLRARTLIFIVSSTTVDTDQAKKILPLLLDVKRDMLRAKMFYQSGGDTEKTADVEKVISEIDKIHKKFEKITTKRRSNGVGARHETK